MKRSLTAEKALTIVGPGFREGDGLALAFSVARPLHHVGEFSQLEWQQAALPSPRIRIHPDDRLTLQIFDGVRDQAILPNYHDDVVGIEPVVGQEAPLQQLEATLTFENAFGFQQLLHVDVVLAQVIHGVHVVVLQIELRLRPGVEALGEFLQSGLA